MLTTIYTTYKSQFEAMANAWFEIGATSFKLTEFTQTVAGWGEHDVAHPQNFEAPIKLRGLNLGSLHLTGLKSTVYLARLQSDADFISQLILVDGEMEALTSELVETQDQLLALYDVTRSARSQVKIPNLLASVLQVITQMIHIEGVFIRLTLGNKKLHLQKKPKNFITDDLVHWAYDLVIEEADSYLSNDNDRSRPLPKGIQSILVCPIKIEGKIRGVAGLINRIDQQFKSPDIKLIEAVIQNIEVHIENALLQEQRLQKAKLQTEMALARDVQLQLLPQDAPISAELDIASFALPALEVGGDFYDFIGESNGPLVFTVGDVAGKGMPSALLMAMIRTAMRSSVRSLEEPCPKLILDRTNEDLYDDFTEVGMFATVFVGYHQPHSKTLIYANAGHSPVIYCPKSGQPRLLEADGTAVGVLPTNLAENQKISFSRGDLLVVATDGFAEARNPVGELFGYDKLLESVAAIRELGAKDILESLYRTISNFGAGSLQDDDQTIIVVKGK
ncbi:MAG: SpoIIE family protein phosphatase [Chloroflexota bacterium]